MKNLFYFFALLITGGLSAQTPFWGENFSNGIPANWTNADASNQNAIWTWCNDPASDGADPGCPKVWSDATNNQVPFGAATASNGFVTLDSDEYGQLPADHISELTTGAIDCSGKSTVFLKFETLLGTYTYDADDKAIIRVSTDQVNWTAYQVFSGLTTSVRWSTNPYPAIIDITASAANKSTVYIQWQWTGNYEYMWNVDDVELYPVNPTPLNDLSVGDVFYPLSSYATPASEIKTDTCAFYAYVNNKGLVDQHQVKLKAWVTDASNAVLFADSITINTLPAGYVDSMLILPKLFVPNVPEGEYTIRYAVTSDSIDARVNDNLVTTTFLATSNYFAKEDGAEQFYRPSSLTDPWYVCNYYKLSKTSLEKYKAVSIGFAHTTNEGELPINTVDAGVYLLRVNDDIKDDLSNLDDASFFGNFAWLGLGEYVAADTAVADGSVHDVDIVDLAVGTPGVELETGARYFAAISYGGASNQAFQGYNDDNKYFFTSTIQYGGSSFYSFGDDVNAVVRLNLALLVTTDDVPLPAEAMEVFPNPATDQVNLGIKLLENGPATVTIADLSGRLIMTQDYDNLQQEVLNYKLPKLASGTYLARIATKNGTLTKKFNVVAK